MTKPLEPLEYIIDSQGNKVYVGECFHACTINYKSEVQWNQYREVQWNQYRLVQVSTREDDNIDFRVELMDAYPAYTNWTNRLNPDGTPAEFAPGEFNKITCRTCPNLLVCIANGQVSYQTRNEDETSTRNR